MRLRKTRTPRMLRRDRLHLALVSMTYVAQAATVPPFRHHGVVDSIQVEALRALLAPTGWLDRTTEFATALRRRARTPHGLLIVGTPADEPWHITAHLADESRLTGLPELEPTLVRWSPPPGAPPHLRIGIDRLEQAGRSETLLVVTPDTAPDALLERLADARKSGSAIFALDRGDPELDDLAHEALDVRPANAPVSFDGAQHLVSVAVGDSARDGRPRDGRWDGQRSGGFPRDADPGEFLLGARQARNEPRPDSRAAQLRGRLGRLLDAISGPSDRG